MGSVETTSVPAAMIALLDTIPRAAVSSVPAVLSSCEPSGPEGGNDGGTDGGTAGGTEAGTEAGTGAGTDEDTVGGADGGTELWRGPAVGLRSMPRSSRCRVAAVVPAPAVHPRQRAASIRAVRGPGVRWPWIILAGLAAPTLTIVLATLAKQLCSLAGLDLGKQAIVPIGRGFHWYRDPELLGLSRENLGILAAIGEKKATQLLAHLAGLLDPESRSGYEKIFQAWGGDVRERSVDLASGRVRPREISIEKPRGVEEGSLTPISTEVMPVAGPESAVMVPS